MRGFRCGRCRSQAPDAAGDVPTEVRAAAAGAWVAIVDGAGRSKDWLKARDSTAREGAGASRRSSIAMGYLPASAFVMRVPIVISSLRGAGR